MSARSLWLSFRLFRSPAMRWWIALTDFGFRVFLEDLDFRFTDQ